MCQSCAYLSPFFTVPFGKRIQSHKRCVAASRGYSYNGVALTFILVWGLRVFDYTTIFTSGGGGGSSLRVVASVQVSSTFMLPVLTEAETHLKNALIVV